MEEENKPQLDTLFIKTLEDILKKEPRELTKQDKAFLKARWHYVRSKTSREIFKDVVFGDEPEEELVEEKGKTQPKKEVKKQDTITTTITEQDEEEGNSNNPFENEDEE